MPVTTALAIDKRAPLSTCAPRLRWGVFLARMQGRCPNHVQGNDGDFEPALSARDDSISTRVHKDFIDGARYETIVGEMHAVMEVFELVLTK